MIALFLEHAPARLADARAAHASADAPTTAAALHSLKSSASNLGATYVQDLCARGEAMVRTGAIDGMSEILDELDGELRRVYQWLQSASPETA